MSQLIEIKIDVTKISKDKLYEGQKGKYLTIVASINDDVDTYGNDVSVYEAQTDDEKTAKEKKNFLGNGKTFWVKGSGLKTAKDKQGRQASADTGSKVPDFAQADDDDLPF